MQPFLTGVGVFLHISIGGELFTRSKIYALRNKFLTSKICLLASALLLLLSAPFTLTIILAALSGFEHIELWGWNAAGLVTGISVCLYRKSVLYSRHGVAVIVQD